MYLSKRCDNPISCRKYMLVVHRKGPDSRVTSHVPQTSSCSRAVRASDSCSIGQRRRFKPKTYTINLYEYLAWLALLIGLDKDWFAQCHANATEWGIGSWCQWPILLAAQQSVYKVSMNPQSQVGIHSGRTLNVARA